MVSILIKNECNPGTAINILIYFVHERDLKMIHEIKLFGSHTSKPFGNLRSGSIFVSLWK